MKKTLGKPEAHSDVINKHPSTLIIGYGWVGQFIGKYFNEADFVTSEGSPRSVSDNELYSFRDSYRLGFITVPTPMLPSGQCDISIVEDAIKKYKDIVAYFCIKSTVEVGTVDYLEKKYGMKGRICMSPEYVGETLGHPLVDPERNTFIILGGEKNVTEVFAEAFTLVTNSYTRIYQVTAKTAELCKLMENSFIATKVMFVNEFKNLSDEIGVDWNQLREVWLADPRVSRSHTYAYSDNPGFSGKCLPKDLNNLVYYFKKKLKSAVYPRLIEFLLKYNSDLRLGVESSVPLLPYEKNQ